MFMNTNKRSGVKRIAIINVQRRCPGNLVQVFDVAMTAEHKVKLAFGSFSYALTECTSNTFRIKALQALFPRNF